jgi:chromosome partitioning protein
MVREHARPGSSVFHVKHPVSRLPREQPGIYTPDRMGTCLVFANQKGGVGKTTTAVNLGAALVEKGKSVLLVDFDPQGNTTSSVGLDSAEPGVYEVITGQISARDAIRDTVVPGLRAIGSGINLTGATVELVGEEGRERFLKKALDPIVPEHDYVFVDCPPSLGILTLNGLVAANGVIIPLQCEYFALEGLRLLLQTISKVQSTLNPGLRVAGILFTMYDSRTRLANEVVQQVTRYFRDRVFRTIIPRNVRLSEAPSHGKPVLQYDPDCQGTLSYRKLAEEVIANA